MSKHPLPGEIWRKIKHEYGGDVDSNGTETVLIVADPNWEVAWRYIPRQPNYRPPSPHHDNAWTRESFLKYFVLDEVSMVKKILERYEET